MRAPGPERRPDPAPSAPSRPWLEPLLWIALGAGSIPLVRPWQPSPEMTVLVVGVVICASAGLLHTVRRPLASRSMWAASALLATAAAGCAAAISVRILYRLTAPGVQPFGLAFNIAADSGWTAINALLVALLLRALKA